MSSLTKATLLCYTLLLFSSGCTSEETKIDPFPSIDGIYQATLYRTSATGFGPTSIPMTYTTTVVTPYPIYEHKLTMIIESLTEDSVRVDFQPSGDSSNLPPSIFSPTKPRVFLKAYVGKEIVNKNQRHIFIYLNSGKNLSKLDDGVSIYSDGKQADYQYDIRGVTGVLVPPVPDIKAVIKFEKLL
jgi:hypothetical protein